MHATETQPKRIEFAAKATHDSKIFFSQNFDFSFIFAET